MTGSDRSHGLLALSHVWQHVKLPDAMSWARPRYNIVVDEDVKKPNNQTNKKAGRGTVAQSLKRAAIELGIL